MDRSRLTPHKVMDKLLDTSGVAEILGVSTRTVKRLVAARKLPHVRIGRMVRFLPADVFRWVEARKE